MAAAPSMPFAVDFQLRRKFAPPQVEQPAPMAAVFPMLLSPVKCIPPPSALQRFSIGPAKDADRVCTRRGLPAARAATSDCHPASVPARVYSPFWRSPDWKITPEAPGPTTSSGITKESPHQPTCRAQCTRRLGCTDCRYCPSSGFDSGLISTPIASSSPRIS
jgi:hypothetical protein